MEKGVEKLFRNLESYHKGLIRIFKKASKEDTKNLEKIRKSFQKLFGENTTEVLKKKPKENEWSAWEVLKHLVDHDADRNELNERGIKHYIEHGFIHLKQAKEALKSA